MIQRIIRTSNFARLPALLAVLGIGIVAFFKMTLDRTPFAFFYMDDFVGIQSKLETLEFATNPYGGHISYCVAIWSVMLEFFGTSRYFPFMVLALSLTVLNALCLGNLTKRISSQGLAVVAILWLLYLGPAFHNQLWDQASLSQLASISIFGIAALNQENRFYIICSLLLLFVGFGVGGLGFGVAVALIVLLFLERRFVVSALISGAVFLVLLIARSSLAETGNNPISVRNIATVPNYMISALAGTIRTAANLPAGIAEIFAVGVLVLSIPVVPIAYSKLSTTASRAFFLSGVYLMVTWGLAGLVRGDLSEVAAPRYVGVTAPVLFVYTVALLELLRTGRKGSASSYRRFFELLMFPKVLVVLTAMAALSNSGIWLSSRDNANYLGSFNIAKLAAIYDAEDWISPDFKPTGEGLDYVSASLINSAWRSRGVPDFSGYLERDSPFRSASNSQWITTLLEAGLVAVVPTSGKSVPTNEVPCTKQAVTMMNSSTEIKFFNIENGITIRNKFSDPLVVRDSSGNGILSLQQLSGASNWIFETTSGCLISEKTS